MRQSIAVAVVVMLAVTGSAWATSLLPLTPVVDESGFGTLFASLLQEKITTSSRATVTSIVGLGDSLGAMVGFLIFGTLTELGDIKSATVIFMTATIVLCLIARRLLVLWKI